MHIKVIDDIYMVGGMEYSEINDCCVYLLNSKYKVLIDSGLGKRVDKIMDNINELGVNPFEIKYLILTHCHIDHIGGAKRLRDEIGLKIIAHMCDTPAIMNADRRLTAANWYNLQLNPIDVDIILDGEEGYVNDISELKWLHIPGHTPGSIALLYERDDMKVLFGQDVHGPLHSEFKSDTTAYKKSLQKLIGLDADILCEGHYGIIRGKERVRGFMEQFI
ncbi:MAG: MBL fold metallo-hydrolase [Deltaproteobacteria bacterium]|nr:MBL fold metallo-hydrolase [Deltaproteobacteria bacterium]